MRPHYLRWLNTERQHTPLQPHTQIYMTVPTDSTALAPSDTYAYPSSPDEGASVSG